MTAPTPSPPHQDPAQRSGGVADQVQVTLLEHVTTLVHTLDRRFDTLHQDLKDHVAQRFTDSDLRYQQRFDAQTNALDAALAAAKEAVATAMIAAEKATTKAETASDKRFASVNEFRQTLSDQTASFMPRGEAQSRLDGMAEKIDDLKAYQLSTTGRASATPTMETRLMEVMNEVRALRESRSADQGKSTGLNAGWGYLIGAIGLIAVVVNLIINVANK